MGRAQGLVAVVLVFLVVACGGGGGSSPTEPEPTPESLEGSWRGQLSGSAGGGAFTCSLEVTLNPIIERAYFGSWSAQCPWGEVGSVAVGFESMFTETVFVSGEGSTEMDPGGAPLGACGWTVPAELVGNQLVGTWQPDEECEEPSLTGGPLSLRFIG